MTLTKEKIIDTIYNQVGLSKNQSRRVVESLLEIIKQTLTKNENLLISGFGKFIVKDGQLQTLDLPTHIEKHNQASARLTEG